MQFEYVKSFFVKPTYSISKLWESTKITKQQFVQHFSALVIFIMGIKMEKITDRAVSFGHKHYFV